MANTRSRPRERGQFRMNWKAMENNIDCGKVAISNHLGILTGRDPQEIYSMIGRQPKWWPFSDFWDSPSRHFKIIKEITGQSAGLVPADPLLVPSVVLLKLSLTAWHWVTVASVGHQTFTWHDGRGLTNKTFQERFPGCKVVMAYALGGVISLPWYWRVWGFATSWI